MAEAAVAEVTIIPVSKGASKQIEDALGGEQTGQKVGGQVGDGLLSALGKTLKVGAVAVGGVAIAGIGTIIAKGFQRLDALDQANAKLVGLGHSAQTVQLIMDNALASVKGTAFGMGDAATVAASMVAAGIKPGEELQKTLSLVGDAATIAGVGMTDMGSVFGKVAASNKAQMDTFNQLADMGVPALALVAQQLGVTQETASTMASAGQIDFATFQAAMESGLGGAALSSGSTFQGAMDNMGAAAGRLGEKLLGGFFPALTGGFGDLTVWLDSLGPKALEMGAAFGAFVAGVLPQLIAGIQTFGGILLGVIDWVGQNIALIRNLGIAAGIAIAAVLGFRAVLAVMQAYQAVMAVVTAAQLGFGAAQVGTAGATMAVVAATTLQKAAYIAGAAASGIATAAQWLFNTSLLASPITWIVLAIAALVAGLILFFTQTELGQQIWTQFTNFLGEAWDNIVAGFQAVVGFFGEAWANITSFFTAAYEGVIKPILDGIGAVFTWLYENIIIPIIGGIVIYISIWAAAFLWLWNTVISPVIGFIGTVFTWVYESIIKPVIDAIAAAVMWVAGVISIVFNAIALVWQTVWGAISAFFMAIWEAIVGYVTAYLNVVWTIISTVGAAIGAVWNTIWGGISSFFSAIWSAIVGYVTAYINTVWAIITTVGNAISGVWNSIWGGISSFFIGIWNNIMGTVNTVGSVFANAFSSVAGIITGAFNGVVGVIKSVINSIIDVVNGAISGINNVASTVGAAFGVDVQIGRIPRLASGGVVTARPGGILANIGEGRYDEAVVPLSPKVLAGLEAAGSSRSSSVSSGSVVSQSVNETIQLVVDGRVLAETTRSYQRSLA